MGKLLPFPLKRAIPPLVQRERERRFGYLVAALCCFGLAAAVVGAYGMGR